MILRSFVFLLSLIRMVCTHAGLQLLFELSSLVLVVLLGQTKRYLFGKWAAPQTAWTSYSIEKIREHTSFDNITSSLARF